MQVTYLKKLEQNPNKHSLSNKSLTISEIEQLEVKYNAGVVFPQALRELLFLAGKYCIVLDYGLNESQQELQNFVRSMMNDENKTISRPFFAIDIYNAYDQFIFVYLDEGDNPPVYGAQYEETNDRPNWIIDVDTSLSNYINYLVDRVKKGENPF